MEELETLLHQNVSPVQIINLLQGLDEEDRNILVQDIYAYAINTQKQDLERSILLAFPDLYDLRLAEYVWIYAQIYDRPDLEDLALPYLHNLPWNKLLPIALIEGNEDLAEHSLAEGFADLYPDQPTLFMEEDLILSLLAAYRMGFPTIANYISSILGPDIQRYVELGYVMEEPRDASIPYQVLFTQE